jgi:rhodanese-related sulfurtransferase
VAENIDRIIFLFVVFGAALVVIRGYRLWRTYRSWIEPEDLKRRLDEDEDLLVLDIRTPQEFQEEPGHICGAVNLPFAELSARLKTAKPNLGAFRHTKVVLACKIGARSSNALLQLEWAGLRNVHVLRGGVRRWNERGFPVDRSMSS